MLTESPNSKISIHEVFADLDLYAGCVRIILLISIHEVFADLDSRGDPQRRCCLHFNPRGLRRPRPAPIAAVQVTFPFQSTRSSQTSTMTAGLCTACIGDFNPRGLRRPRLHGFNLLTIVVDFNPRGLRRPRLKLSTSSPHPRYFNPRGLRRPRLDFYESKGWMVGFQSTRSSQTSTRKMLEYTSTQLISIHEVFADLDD